MHLTSDRGNLSELRRASQLGVGLDDFSYMGTFIPLLTLCSPKDTVIVSKGEEWQCLRCIIASILQMWDHAFMLNFAASLYHLSRSIE